MFISLKDCLEEKVLLERKLAVALGLLATCKLDLDLEGEIVQRPGEEEERDEALFNFPLGNNNDEPPPPYVRIKTFTHNSTRYVYIYVK